MLESEFLIASFERENVVVGLILFYLSELSLYVQYIYIYFNCILKMGTLVF